MRTRLALVPALGVATVFALAGCAGGTPSPDTAEPDGTSTEEATEPEAETVGACIQGVWELDGQRNADQLQENFSETGLMISATAVDGGVTLTIDDSTMTYDSAITYTMTGDMNGLELIIAQNQTGVSSGSWTESGGVLSFSDWETGIAVNNTITIGGTVSEFPIELPQDVGSGSDMTVTCSGDSLETKPEGSPFTGYWSRVG